MNKTRLWIFTVLIALILVFIWGNSLLNAETSKALSDYLRTNVLGYLFDEMNANQASFLVRKLAHFSEYAVLGGVLMAAFYKIRFVFFPVAICASVAMMDEMIQIYTGRTSSMKDVLIDSTGAVLGICIAIMVILLTKNRDKKEPCSKE